VNLGLFIARRYFFSKKSTNVINIISGISMLGVFVGSAALLIVISAFNGFEKIAIELQNAFNAELKIEPSIGKFFDPSNSTVAEIKNLPGIAYYNEILEENVLFKFKESQHIGKIKGVSDTYVQSNEIDSNMVSGEYMLSNSGIDYAVIGIGVEYALSLYLYSGVDPITVYAPKKSNKQITNYQNAFKAKNIYHSGVFSIEQEFDQNYMIAPISFTRDLLTEPSLISYIELQLSDEINSKKFQRELKELLGEDFTVKNRIQQNETLYKILNSERWAVFLILTFILIIAICNIIGSMTMLVIDKRKDVAILMSMGAKKQLVQRIFMLEGMLISGAGVFAGLLVGGLACWLQITFALIKASGLVGGVYPMALRPFDFFLILFTVLILGFLASWYAAKQNVKQVENISKEIAGLGD
jgi:lipoprotein-releasing system permease protein